MRGRWQREGRRGIGGRSGMAMGLCRLGQGVRERVGELDDLPMWPDVHRPQ